MKNPNKELEEYLRRLTELNEKIGDNTDDDDLMIELNKIITGMSNEMQMDVSKPSLYFINKSDNPDPKFDHEGVSGFDLRANIQNPPTYLIQINPREIKVIPTGLYFEIAKGLEIQIRPKRGISTIGVFILNSPGTVNSCCREEIRIVLGNFGESPYTVRNGDVIAQGVVCPVKGEGSLNLVKVEKLSEK
jgi:dUTP pyrophosphatase